jgi:hypothetical protein
MSMMKPFSRFQHGKMNTLSSDKPISDDELMAFAPAIFQEIKHAERSERYTHVPTALVHQEMVKAGFYPVKVVKTTARVGGDSEEARAAAAVKESFAKHLVMYRHPDALNPLERHGIGQVGYVGDHAGRCSVQLFAGWLELLCGNGLIAGRVVEAIRLSHVKLDVMDVIKAAVTMMESIGRISEWRQELQSIEISLDTAMAFADEALKLRWDDGKAPIYPSQLLEKRRAGDTYSNLWGVYQLAEEALRKGKQRPSAAYDRYWSATAQEQKLLIRPKQVAPLNALDSTLEFEKSISNLADDWRLKLAA